MDEILKMPVGREMDVLVFKHIMGGRAHKSKDGKWWFIDDKCGNSYGWDDEGYLTTSTRRYPTEESAMAFCPHYSNDDDKAIEVVKELGIAIVPQSDEKGFRWFACDVSKIVYGGYGCADEAGSLQVFEKGESGNSGETIALVVCRAALLSKFCKDIPTTEREE